MTPQDTQQRNSPTNEWDHCQLESALAEVLTSGTFQRVKQGVDREVIRFCWHGHDVHVKCFCAPRTLARRLMHWWQTPAEREYRKLQAAATRRIAAPESLGFAISPDGRSYLMTATVSDAVPLSHFMEVKTNGRPLLRRAVFRALGRFLAELHVAGLYHRDLHPGNILVRMLPNQTPQFLLVDFGPIRVGVSLSFRRTWGNLAMLNRWFILRSTRTERLRCWLEYVQQRKRLQSGWKPNESLPCRIERAAEKGNRRLWRRWAYRCLTSNNRFVHTQERNAELFRVRDVPFPDHWATWCRPTPPATAGFVFKVSRSSWVIVHDLWLNGTPRPVIVKWMRGTSRWREWIRRWWAPADLRAWIHGHRLRDCLLPTPRPLALYRAKDGRGSLLVTDYLSSSIDLRAAILSAHPKLRRQRLQVVARLVRRLHQRGWAHRDLKATNILLQRDSNGEESAWIIDLAGAWRPIRLTHARRQRDLARLHASFHDMLGLTRTDRLRFLQWYWGERSQWKKAWKKWWYRIQQASERKKHQNVRRGRPLT